MHPTDTLRTYRAHDGLLLHYHVWETDMTPLRGQVVIAHGYAEHGGRYAHVAQALNQLGLHVFALDHRGHGRSDGTQANVRRFKKYSLDLAGFIAFVNKQAEVPLVLLGHSMGGVIALQTGLEHPQHIHILMLSAPYLMNAVAISGPTRFAARVVSRILPDLPVQDLNADDISRDPDEVKAYREDPWVYTGRVKARIGWEMLRAGPALLPRASELSLPVLIMHGTGDHIADYRGSQALFDTCGSQDKTLKLYDEYYHEIFNDIDSEKPIADMCVWLTAKLDETPA